MNYPASDLLKRLPTQFFSELVSTIQRYKQEGFDVINLGQGNPDLPTPHHIVEALTDAATNPRHHQYSPFQGYQELKQAVSDYYLREYNVTIDPDTEVAILPGTKTGLVELSQCLLNPNDTVLVPDPGYPDYISGVKMVEATMIPMPLVEAHDFLPDYHALPKEAHAAKLMFLNYPNNPTGAKATPRFFEETVQFATEHNIAVCHDFAYHTIQFDGETAPSFLQTPGAKEVGIEMFTLSKAYNMAGWRVGFAVGNKDIIEKLELIQDHLYVSIFGAVQMAAVAALTGDQSATKALTATYEKRRNVLIDALSDIGWNVTKPSGTFFCWLKIPEGYTSESFSRYLLDTAKVMVAPGNGFGDYGEGYVRVALLDSDTRLSEAAKRIEETNIFNTTTTANL